jgi:hypothetical protein
MNSQFRSVTLYFREAFTVPGLTELQPAGTYKLEHEDEPIPGVNYLAYRRVHTWIEIKGQDGAIGRWEIDAMEVDRVTT